MNESNVRKFYKYFSIILTYGSKGERSLCLNVWFNTEGRKTCHILDQRRETEYTWLVSVFMDSKFTHILIETNINIIKKINNIQHYILKTIYAKVLCEQQKKDASTRRNKS